MLHIALLHEQVTEGSRHCKAPKQAASTKGGRTRRENTPHALHWGELPAQKIAFSAFLKLVQS